MCQFAMHYEDYRCIAVANRNPSDPCGVSYAYCTRSWRKLLPLLLQASNVGRNLPDQFQSTIDFENRNLGG